MRNSLKTIQIVLWILFAVALVGVVVAKIVHPRQAEATASQNHDALFDAAEPYAR